MPLSPHLRAALWMTVGAALFVLLVLTRLVRTMMDDPFFGRGDNPIELLSLLACVLGPLLVLGSASGLAMRYRWGPKVGRAAAVVLILAAVAVLVNLAIAGSAETGQSKELVTAQIAAGFGSLGGGLAMFWLMRRLR